MSWALLSSHGLALVAVARQPESRIRDVAAELGVTERAAWGLISDLVAAGYLERVREGRRNRYLVRTGQALPHPSMRTHHVSELLAGLGVHGEGTCEALVLACTDYRTQVALTTLLAEEDLLGRSEVVLWPGGGPALAGSDRGHVLDVLATLTKRRRPRRVLLVAHRGCAVPEVPTIAGASVLQTHRSVRRWGRRIVRETDRRLGLTPELWLIDRGKVGRVSAGRVPRSSGRRSQVRQAT